MRSSRPPGSTRGTQGTRWRLLACALVAAAGLVLAWPELPDPLFATPASAIAVARDGTLLGGRIASDGHEI